MAAVMIVSGVGGLFLTQGTAVADVDSVRGTGYGISVRLAGSFVIPPTPDPTVNPPLLVANESSSDFGPHTASLITIGGVLGILNNGIAVGPVATQAANIVGENHLGSIASNSQVANISALSDAINIPLISTTCVANGDGFTTSVNVSNARLGALGALGAQLLNGPVAANTTIDVVGLATIRLHERQVVENVAPTGGNPGRTRVVVNGARISVPMDGSILEIILAQAECEAVGPDVLLPSTTTSTTVAATTTSTTGATTTSTTGATTTSTTSASTTTSTTSASTTTSTTAATSTTSTTAPPTGTIASTTTTTVAGVVTTVGSGVLVRTGSSLKPLAMLSMVSIVLGILLLIGSGRPLTANAGAGYAALPDGAPEKWGPVEVGKTIWAGFAMLIMGPGELLLRRRRRSSGGGERGSP